MGSRRSVIEQVQRCMDNDPVLRSTHHDGCVMQVGYGRKLLWVQNSHGRGRII